MLRRWKILFIRRPEVFGCRRKLVCPITCMHRLENHRSVCLSVCLSTCQFRWRQWSSLCLLLRRKHFHSTLLLWPSCASEDPGQASEKIFEKNVFVKPRVWRTSIDWPRNPTFSTESDHRSPTDATEVCYSSVDLFPPIFLSSSPFVLFSLSVHAYFHFRVCSLLANFCFPRERDWELHGFDFSPLFCILCQDYFLSGSLLTEFYSAFLQGFF